MLGRDANQSSDSNHVNPSPLAQERKKSKKKRKNNNKPNTWADKCMYAELLEMISDDPWPSSVDALNDGLPNDLESGWVAVGPVPVGKRCLAVTHQSSGIAGNGLSLRHRPNPHLIHIPQSRIPLYDLDFLEKSSSHGFHLCFLR